MPQWIHDRAKHIQEKNPDMPESQAFAIATQQSHAIGKSPKGYGTAEGRRTAKAKYDSPKSSYKKTAMLAGFLDELDQIEKDAGKIRNLMAGLAMTGALAGGGAKMVKNVATHTPAAITQSVGHAAPTTLGVGGLGGRSAAAKEVREFMP